VIRDVEAIAYDEAVHQQIEDVKKQKQARTLQEMLMSGETWEIR